jgi:AhpD family alkylhydroperoxidase
VVAGIAIRRPIGSKGRRTTAMGSRAEVEADIKETLGLVPSFFSEVPDEVLAQEWELFKRYEFGETHISGKYKQLIGLAVHSDTHCRYCTLFHTAAARLNGATDEEIEEAVHFAKHTAGWSTYLNGMQQDYDQFAAELSKVGEFVSGAAG